MKSLLLAVTILISVSAFGQGSRLKGGKFFEAGLGFRGSGANIFAYGGLTFSTNLKGKIGGGIGTGKFSDVSYQYVFMDGLASYSFYEVGRSFYLNAVGGISLNGDIKNKFESATYNKNFSFNYGVVGGLEAEFYASRTMMLTLFAQERYYVKKDFGHWRYQLGAAVRITF